MSKKQKRKESLRPRPTGRGLPKKDSPKPAREGWFKPFWIRYRRVIVPCAVFFVLVGFFIFLYSRLVFSQPFHDFMGVTARVTAAMLNLTGRGVQVQDTVVYSNQFGFQIVDLCTAVMPMMIFAAAVLAFPSGLKEKIVGLLLGLAGIFAVNQIRLVSLFYIGIYAPGIFETTHLLVWQSLMILLAIGLWMIWVYKYVRTSVF